MVVSGPDFLNSYKRSRSLRPLIALRHSRLCPVVPCGRHAHGHTAAAQGDGGWRAPRRQKQQKANANAFRRMRPLMAQLSEGVGEAQEVKRFERRQELLRSCICSRWRPPR